MSAKYTAEPKEVYTLELNRLQRRFSEMQLVGEEASELSGINWRHVEFLRHLNFILNEAVMTSRALMEIPH